MHITEFSTVAERRGGRCLNPDDYVNASSKLTWECLEGHTWQARWNNVKHGSWCPQCRLKSEALVRAFLEFVTGLELPSTKPTWLRNCGGPRAYYQLDGLNEDACLAFEYHGPQHYRHVEAFHDDKSKLSLQQERDAFVRQVCQNRGIQLIEVATLPTSDIFQQIAHIKGYCEPVLGTITDATVAEFLKRPFGTRILDKLQAHAREKGGECLSPIFTGVRTKYEWQCQHGHRWHATWTHIKDGSWCPFCGNQFGPTPELIVSTARARGGICLTPDAYSRKKKLVWQCASGHTWDATWVSVQQGNWCPKCGDARAAEANRLSPETLRSHAIALGGQCLNPSAYDGNTRKLQWVCCAGHEWSASWASVQQGHWCPQCARIEKANYQREPINALIAKAKELGGTLVSPDAYKNSATPIEWSCANGHIWLARWSDVKRGRWCSTCKRALKRANLPVYENSQP